MGSPDVAVVGAGLVGLATAKALLEARPGLRLTVYDKEQRVAAHQSGRNSGVLHAGLYYPPGSLKARFCREGREELIRFADERGIPYRISGKLVVAADESELGRFDALYARGRENGLALELLDDWRALEPHVVGVRAFHVPESGVIDYGAVARAYADVVRELGGELVLGREVHDPGELPAGAVVTCGGLQADRLARGPWRIVPFRGDYYALRNPELVRGLVYPVPDPAFPFLGVHFTRRVDGSLLAGPNAVPAAAREGYGRLSFDLRDTLDVLRQPGFYRLVRAYARTGTRELWRDLVKPAMIREMRRYVPAIRAADVSYAPAGVRAQVLGRDGSLVDDFLIEDGERALHVVNAPSPAATASLVVGRHVAERAIERFAL